jgi:hypothetical protein
LVAFAGGNYFLVVPRLALAVPARQAMKGEYLEGALDERRKADAEAAEKRRLEEEARATAGQKLARFRGAFIAPHRQTDAGHQTQYE